MNMPGYREYMHLIEGTDANVTIKKTDNFKWNIVIKDDKMTVGCRSYTIDEWFNFTDDEINNMHESALAWWKEVKNPLFNLLIALKQIDPSNLKSWQDDWF